MALTDLKRLALCKDEEQNPFRFGRPAAHARR